MSQAVPSQHPAVVLRSHYVHLRAMLAVALAVVIGLTLALVIVAANSGSGGAATVTRPASAPATSVYNGGHEEGLAGASVGRSNPNIRYDGGPEEGIAGH
jgi:hypothetical protein